MGRWRAASLLLNHMASRKLLRPAASSLPRLRRIPPQPLFSSFRTFCALPSVAPEVEPVLPDIGSLQPSELEPEVRDVGCAEPRGDPEIGSIPIKAFFLSTGIDLKSLQAENLGNVLPATSRSSNYIALEYWDFPSDITGIGSDTKVSSCQYMVVCQYGSAVLFNIEDHEVESYLKIIRRHATGLLPETKKDDYAVMEKPQLDEDMKAGPDYIVLRSFDTDSIRIIGSILGQSIALDYFVSQVDGMVEEFAEINRILEKTGNFTMSRMKLFQLVGKANSFLADVILKVGIFDRSEIAWREAKYSQIYEFLKEEFEITQRFSNLNFKLKFIEHNIHFLQEARENKKSNLLEWCIIFLLTIENVLSVTEMIRDSNIVLLQ